MTLPNDADAEQAVIGSCLINPYAILTLDLAESDFYMERNATIWRTLKALQAHSTPTDYRAVVSHLEADGKLDDVGGATYIASLITTVPTAAHVEYYAAIVREKSERRALIRLAGEVAGAAYDETRDIEQARISALTGLATVIRTQGQAQPIAHWSGALMGEIDTAMNSPQDIYGIRTGFRDLDRVTRGLQRGEVFLLCGEPGAGKSLLAGQIAFNASTTGFYTTVYALEMKAIANVRRIISSETRILTSQMRSGRLNTDEYNHVSDAAKNISGLPLWISDDTQWTTATLRADIARLKAKEGLDLVVIDYLGLLKDKGFDPLEKDKIISQGLHDLAKDFDVSILAVHTLNKVGIRNGALSLADAGGSVKIVYDADVAAFLTKYLPQGNEPTYSDADQRNLRTISFLKYREDDPERHLHLVKAQVDTGNGKSRGLPRFDDYAGEY